MLGRSSASSQLLRGLRTTARWSGLGTTLPAPVLRDVALRFGRLAVALVTLKMFFIVVLWSTGHLERYDLSWIDWVGQLGYFVGGVGIWWLARVEALPPGRLLDLGYAWEVLTGFQLSMYVNAGPWPDFVMPGWSPTAAWAMMVALLIPGPPLKATLAAVLTIATEPLSLFIHASQGMALPSQTLLFDRFSPSAAALLLSVCLAQWVHRLQRQLAEASEVGSYRLVEKLGEGGMGEVWRARHRYMARPAAVKLIRPDTLGPHGETVIQRFEREAQTTATLQCPNTVAVYDFGHADDGRLFYVMELLDGLDLDTLVAEHGPLPPARVAHLLRQACRSLAEAHTRGLVHRDVKPANLFVCRHGGEFDVLKVLDFGLVRQTLAGADPKLTHDGQLTGTPAYAAPEQMLGEPVSPATDLYALGCVAFWLLTGKTVFEGETAALVVAQHLRDPPRPPSSVVAGVPPALDALVMACLAKAPEARPADAAEVGRRLQELARQWTGEEAVAWWAGVGPEPNAQVTTPPGLEGPPHAAGSGGERDPTA